MIQEWIFTFGCGHDLHKYYVSINDTEKQARERMVVSFGQHWACQYPSREEAGTETWKLKEIKFDDETSALSEHELDPFRDLSDEDYDKEHKT